MVFHWYQKRPRQYFGTVQVKILSQNGPKIDKNDENTQNKTCHDHGWLGLIQYKENIFFRHSNCFLNNYLHLTFCSFYKGPLKGTWYNYFEIDFEYLDYLNQKYAIF